MAAKTAPPRLEDVIRQGGRHVAPSDGSVMVLVPAGEFFAGRHSGDIFAPEDELPGRFIRLRPFLVDRDPVTNERFSRFVAANGYEDARFWTTAGWAWRARTSIAGPLSFTEKGFDGPDQPVAGVSWYEADAYARWAERDLPTEAQWEKAARGVDGRRFPWGDDLPRSELANFNSNVGRTTAPGTFPRGASPYGVHDMSGNVNNWCRDWYWAGFYDWCARAEVRDYPVLDDVVRKRLGVPLAMRADRGGGYATSFGAWEVLSATGRLAWPPARRQLWHGFRCVIEL